MERIENEAPAQSFDCEVRGLVLAQDKLRIAATELFGGVVSGAAERLFQKMEGRPATVSFSEGSLSVRVTVDLGEHQTVLLEQSAIERAEARYASRRGWTLFRAWLYYMGTTFVLLGLSSLLGLLNNDASGSPPFWKIILFLLLVVISPLAIAVITIKNGWKRVCRIGLTVRGSAQIVFEIPLAAESRAREVLAASGLAVTDVQ